MDYLIDPLFPCPTEELQRRIKIREAFCAKWNAIAEEDFTEGCGVDDVEYVVRWPEENSVCEGMLEDKSVVNEEEHGEKPTEVTPCKMELVHGGKMERVQDWINVSLFLASSDRQPESPPTELPEQQPEEQPKQQPEEQPEKQPEQQLEITPRPVNVNRSRSVDHSIHSTSTVVAPIKLEPSWSRSLKSRHNFKDDSHNCFVSLSRIPGLKRPDSRTDILSVCVSTSQCEKMSECRFPALRLVDNFQTRPKSIVAESCDSHKLCDDIGFKFDESKSNIKSDRVDQLHSRSGLKSHIITLPKSSVVPIDLMSKPTSTQPNDSKYKVSLSKCSTTVSDNYNLCLSTSDESVPVHTTTSQVKCHRSTKHDAGDRSTSVTLGVTADKQSVVKSCDTIGSRGKRVASLKQPSTFGPRLDAITANSAPKTSSVVDSNRPGTLVSNLSSGNVDRKSLPENLSSNYSKKTVDNTEKYAFIFNSDRDTSDGDSDVVETERAISNSKRAIKGGTNESEMNGFQTNDDVTRKRVGVRVERVRTLRERNKKESVEEQLKRIFPKAKHWISEHSMNLAPTPEEPSSEKYAMVFKTVDSDEEFLSQEVHRNPLPWRRNGQTSRCKSGRKTTNEGRSANIEMKTGVGLQEKSDEISTDSNRAFGGLERTPVKRSGYRDIPRTLSTPKKVKCDQDTGILDTEYDVTVPVIDPKSARGNIDEKSRINSTPRQSDKPESSGKMRSAMRKLDINKIGDSVEKSRKSPVKRNTSCNLFRNQSTGTSKQYDSVKSEDFKKQIEFDLVSSSDELVTKSLRRSRSRTKKNRAQKSTKFGEESGAQRFDTNQPTMMSSSEDNVLIATESPTRQSLRSWTRRSNSHRKRRENLTINEPTETSDSEKETRVRTSLKNEKKNMSLECGEKILTGSKLITLTEKKSETHNVGNSLKLSAGNGIRTLQDSDDTSDSDFFTGWRYKKMKYVRDERKHLEDGSNSAGKLNVVHNSNSGNTKTVNNLKMFNYKLEKSSKTPELKIKDREKVWNKCRYRTGSSDSSVSLTTTTEISNSKPNRRLEKRRKTPKTKSLGVNGTNNERRDTESEVGVNTGQKNGEISKTEERIGRSKSANRTERDETVLDAISDEDLESRIPATVITKQGETTKENVMVSEKTNLTTLIDELSVTNRSKRIVIEFELASSDDELSPIGRSKKASEHSEFEK